MLAGLLLYEVAGLDLPLQVEAATGVLDGEETQQIGDEVVLAV